MSKIKVCHVISGLKSGGAETVIYNYCSHLSQEKYEFHIIYQHEPLEKDVKMFSKLNFKLIQIPEKSKHPLKNYFATKKYLKDNNIDIVHCHMNLMNFIPLIAAKKCGINTRICHIHSCDVRKKNILIRFIEEILRRLCVKNSTKLVACGEATGKKEYKGKEYTLLYNAIDLEKFKFNSDARVKIRNKYCISDNNIVLGHIGRFIPIKNHKFLLEILSEIVKKDSNYVLMLIGDGELKEEIKKTVKKMHLENNVRFVGVVANANDYYSAMDAFLLPSLFEGLPMVGIEAQSSGLKCLFSDNIDENVMIDNTKSKMLELDSRKWIVQILELCNKYDRRIRKERFNQRNLNILNEVKVLEQIYNKEN